MLLNRQEVHELIKEKGLITDYINLETQLTANGFDLSVGSVFEFIDGGALDFSNKERLIPQAREIPPEKKNPQDKFGWWHLKKGAYKIRTNEVVNLSLELTALAFVRSSLLRMGAFTEHAVWDAGFRGKGEFILVVENPAGLELKQNARISQIIFIRMNKTERGYQGVFQEKHRDIV